MNFIEDKKYLKQVSDIEDYFKDEAYDILECGQGYSQDAATVIAKIGDKFYSVEIKAEIGSAKQDRGDRLYWVEKVESITYTEVSKEIVMADEKARLAKVVDDAEVALAKAKADLEELT